MASRAVNDARARAFVAVALTLAVPFTSTRAEAYRPFDGTDADVVEEGGFELELAPVSYYRAGPQSYLGAPYVTMNFGLTPDTELVLDFDDYVAVGALSPGVPRVSLTGDDFFVKHVFRKGALQGRAGPSVAVEYGVLFPEVNGVDGVGGSLDVIVSYRASWGTVHGNEWFELTRDHHADLFSGVILEGPHDWRLRPVAELFYDKDFAASQRESVLLGAIWTVVDESFSLDAGLRGARLGDGWAAEARLGLTWTVSVAAPPHHAATHAAALRVPHAG